MELPFAGLHQLCLPLLDRLDRLPPPQRRRAAGRARPRVRRGAGPLPGRPGHAHACWPTSPRRARCCASSTITSGSTAPPGRCSGSSPGGCSPSRWRSSSRCAARRDALSGLPELRLEGLGHDDARALLASVVPGRLDPRVARADDRGDARQPARAAGAAARDDRGGARGRVRAPASPTASRTRSSVRRLAPLPEDTRRLLQLAAADPIGDPLRLWRAAAHLGIEPRGRRPGGRRRRARASARRCASGIR